MNNRHLELLLNHFEIGLKINNPKRIYGGHLHKMYQITTDKGTYAIKQLSKDINLFSTSIVNNYELTERIAECFLQNGISSVPALNIGKKHMFICDDTGYLVYPWLNAKTIEPNKFNVDYACKIAKILSKIHKINLHIPEISEPDFYVYKDDAISALVKNSAYNSRAEIANILHKNLSGILVANKRYHSSIRTLKSITVVSHGDLDQKNVLWDDSDNPYLIDWESARKLNPTYEIVNAALDWSGISKEFNEKIFLEMMETYKNEAGLIKFSTLEAAFGGVLGNWINWLVYNIKRWCNGEDLEQQSLGIDQVYQTLPIILNLQLLTPKLINLVSL